MCNILLFLCVCTYIPLTVGMLRERGGGEGGREREREIYCVAYCMLTYNMNHYAFNVRGTAMLHILKSKQHK